MVGSLTWDTLALRALLRTQQTLCRTPKRDTWRVDLDRIDLRPRRRRRPRWLAERSRRVTGPFAER